MHDGVFFEYYKQGLCIIQRDLSCASVVGPKIRPTTAECLGVACPARIIGRCPMLTDGRASPLKLECDQCCCMSCASDVGPQLRWERHTPSPSPLRLIAQGRLRGSVICPLRVSPRS